MTSARSVLFVDWVVFPGEKWKEISSDASAPPPPLRMSGLAYHLDREESGDEVSYNVHSDHVASSLSDTEIRELLGISKVVYSVSVGKLETVLPALLDQLASDVLVVVWDSETYRSQLEPALKKVLRYSDEVLRKAFGRALILKDYLSALGQIDASVILTPTEAIDNLHLSTPEPERMTRLKAMSMLLKHALSVDSGAALESETLQKSLHTSDPLTTPESQPKIQRRPSGAGESTPYESGERTKGAYVVRLRGLPWETTIRDIEAFIAPIRFPNFAPLTPQTCVLSISPQGRCNGEGWIGFDTIEERDQAVTQLHGKTIGRRWIEVFKSTINELRDAQRDAQRDSFREPRSRYNDRSFGPPREQYRRRDSRDGPYSRRSPMRRDAPWSHNPGRSPSWSHGGSYAPPSRPAREPRMEHSPPFGILRLRGLPYGSNENHIVQFFSGFSMTTILPSTVPIDGRPSGEAYVEFATPEEAQRAYHVRQNARIEHRYIELFPASKQEMDMAASGLDAREIKARLSGGRY